MTLLERKFPRRSLLRGGGKVAAAASVLLLVPFVNFACTAENKHSINEGLEKFITDDELNKEKLREVFDVSRQFPVIQLNQIKVLGKDPQLDDLDLLVGERRDLLEKYGIESFSVASDSATGDSLIWLNFIRGRVTIGWPYRDSPTPWPGFIFIYDIYHFNPDAPEVLKTRALAASAYFWGSEGNSLESPMSSVHVYFPVKPTELINQEFVFLFNNQLLQVDGENADPFYLPYRFQLQPKQKV